MLRKLLSTTMLCLLGVAVAFAQNATLSGTVTNAKTGQVLIGANVYIPGTHKGAATDTNGHYKITGLSPGTYTIRVTYVGFQKFTQSINIREGQNTLNFELEPGVTLSQMVVTAALGQKQSLNSVTFATQEIGSKELSIVPSPSIASSLSGKIAGVRFVGQAGAKLGKPGKLRIGGHMSLTGTTTQPLIVVDGVPGASLSVVDMNNVKSVTVLKGANATVLYGSRGANGVVIIQTKNGSGSSGVSVEVNESLTIDKVRYLPQFQNKYGQGYNGQAEWRTYQWEKGDPDWLKPMDGVKYIYHSWADASWGPKLDGTQYGAYYNWFPASPYYGETTSFSPHPNNIKNFWNTGITNKANIAVNFSKPGFHSRISYTNQKQSGILPYTSLMKHYINASFDYDVTDNFHVSTFFAYTVENIKGQVYSDEYANVNQTSHSFNQWFARQVSMKKMKQLVDLKTPQGYFASWNWWNPERFDNSGKPSDWNKKMAFWFNPYTWQKYYYQRHNNKHLAINGSFTYEISDNWSLKGNVSRSTYHNLSRWRLPYSLEYSTDQSGAAYTHFVNSFGNNRANNYENDFRARLNYEGNFDKWTVNAYIGTEFRMRGHRELNAEMDNQNYISGGLIIPNVYTYANSKEQIIPRELNWRKQVYSLFGHFNIGYDNTIFLDGSLRRDWSSSLPADNNGYTYPSIGASFVFTNLMDSDILTYGKYEVDGPKWVMVSMLKIY